MKVGVLAIQGDIREHLHHLQQVGAETVPIKRRDQMAAVKGLVIPGGESTTIGLLMDEEGLLEEISARYHTSGLPIWGTCAGSILLARTVQGRTTARLGLMDMAIDRNAFGRQVASFEQPLTIPALGEPAFPAVFIRAPRIRTVGPDLTVLATLDDEPVMVETASLLATTFHPEMSADLRIHQYFMDKIRKHWARGE